MDIVYCVHDESDYSKHLLPALAALYDNNRLHDIRVTIIHLNISWVVEINELAARFDRLVSYILATEEDIAQLKSLPVIGFLNIGTNLRFLIFKYFQTPVLYLDVDTLVVSDIAELFIDSLGPVAAVQEPSEGFRNDKTRSLGVRTYCNAGVLRLDAGLYDYSEIMDEVSDILCRYGERITWGDQDILNILFDDTKQLFDSAFNFIPLLSQGGAPRIIHYAGRKPWSIRYRFWRAGSYYHIYMRYRLMTPLRNLALADQTPLRWLKYQFYLLFRGYQ